jgi:hypothetical protein
MNSKTWIIASGCMLCLLASACQGPEAQHMFRSQSTPIINGIPDHSEEHRAVVFTKTHASGSSWVYYCSGTLIAPTVVMTAAHCAEGWEPGEYLVHFGFDSSDFEDRYVSEIIYHPNWDFDLFTTIGNDIALLRLTAPAPLGINPIPHLPANLAITRSDIGMPVEYVGFGEDEDGHLGTKLTIGLPLWDVCTTSGGCTGTGGAPLAANTICHSRADGGGTCSGDSGGPAFVERGGVEYVAGITSYGDSNCSSYGCSTKVDVFESWINDFIGSFAINGQDCTNPAQCYSGLCVDGVCCESACDAPCMTCAGDKTAGICSPSPDGTACPDGDPCNGHETCQSGACVSDGVTPECIPTVPCVSGSCVTGQGCVNTPLADGSTCNNDDICDGDDECRAGKCVTRGMLLDCDDHNPCTDDSCNALSGCQHSDTADGTSCADSDVCNGAETCSSGACGTGEILDCDDGNACTTDSCDAATGCAHADMAEGSDCGGGRSCQGGLCLPKKGGGCNTSGNIPKSSWTLLLLMLLTGVFRRRCV